jgi:hypothetical protein
MLRSSFPSFLSSTIFLCRVFTDLFYMLTIYHIGAHGNVVVKALCYKPEGRGFETR